MYFLFLKAFDQTRLLSKLSLEVFWIKAQKRVSEFSCKLDRLGRQQVKMSGNTMLSKTSF